MTIEERVPETMYRAIFSRVTEKYPVISMVGDLGQVLCRTLSHRPGTRARRVRHFLGPHLDYTLNIFKKNIFLCLHLVIALELKISSFPLICISTSVPDTSLRQSCR